MGGASWQRVKESVRAALREMAEGLLKLYAQRAVAEGHPFAADTPWQREFEASFRFEETPDQLRAIEEAKRDMENHAADGPAGRRRRRLRQDRGRAARRVQGGRPTATRWPCWCRRPCSPSSTGPPSPTASAPFPAKVELLSRFRSPKEQKAVVEGLRQGTVDVVIGTHRLLSKDVAVQAPRAA